MKLRMLAAGLFGFCLALVAVWALSRDEDPRRLLHGHPEFRVVSTTNLKWSQNQSHRNAVTYYMKPMFHDDHTGEVAMLVRYPAGQMVEAHTHKVGHGMYVLQGKLVTNKGSFGPGTFVWVPAGDVITHGAGADEDAVVLFMTHEGLTIDYTQPVTH